MKTLKVSPLAQEDLLEIWERIAPENPAAAAKLMATFKEKFNLLLQFPKSGRARDELLLHLRSFAAGKYLIFYQPADDGVEILRVVHSARDMESLFDL